MNKKTLIRSFVLVAVFQLVILAGEYLSSVYTRARTYAHIFFDCVRTSSIK